MFGHVGLLINLKNETCTIHEAMKQDDFPEFVKAMNKEINIYSIVIREMHNFLPKISLVCGRETVAVGLVSSFQWYTRSDAPTAT